MKRRSVLFEMSRRFFYTPPHNFFSPRRVIFLPNSFFGMTKNKNKLRNPWKIAIIGWFIPWLGKGAKSDKKQKASTIIRLSMLSTMSGWLDSNQRPRAPPDVYSKSHYNLDYQCNACLPFLNGWLCSWLWLVKLLNLLLPPQR